MNNPYFMYPCLNLCYSYVPMCNCNTIWNYGYWNISDAADSPNHSLTYPNSFRNTSDLVVKDHGENPFVVNISQAAKQNNTYRDAIWTGKHLQVTLMSINVGEDIGLEIHPDVDQFLRIEEGQGLVQMGKSKDNLNYVRNVGNDSAIMIPAGIWHNVTNTGNSPLKLYSIYAPPHHPFGTVQETKADAEAEDH
ncbi:cupin domain-containing protein [Sporosarcina aquimarina]|uniref:cupin domain-containing protein n=1 Tax=Sporosarcina aquimarina TaxID=114975 RepID=UPI001C8D3EBB|nr:cupin domain-containing protein [Sporosarcina aquimarina]